MSGELTAKLWGEQAKLRYLLLASILLLFTCLGSRDIWTQEHRWADIVSSMFYRNDFLHPYIGDVQYYDKPLLSYWLVVVLAKLFGALSTWTLRIPSASAGMLAIFSLYKIGAELKNKQMGLLSGWLLLTTYYFVFWSRISSADMLNLGGMLFAIAWYISNRQKSDFFTYGIFFIILALTSLCKGLIGAVIPLIVVCIDICLQKSWRLHLKPMLFLSLIPALFIYMAPFVTSSIFGSHNYQENGLYLVYRENFLRYFQPFDHRGPIYTYFIYLPVYLLPGGIILFMLALSTLKGRWSALSINSRWIIWSLLSIFLFLTFSGSRRSYYVLPIVPFAILFIADWLTSKEARLKTQSFATGLILGGFILLFLLIDIGPHFFYRYFGIQNFAAQVKSQAEKIKPWADWQIISLDAESKLYFYLNLSPKVKNFGVEGERKDQSLEKFAKMWPVMQEKHNAIILSRKVYEPILLNYFPDYKVIESRIFSNNKEDAPLALIPAR